MHSPNIKTNVDVEVTLNNIDIESVLRNVCDKCHEGLMDVSIHRMECGDNPSLNTAKKWREECEYLEGILCRILDYLGD